MKSKLQIKHYPDSEIKILKTLEGPDSSKVSLVEYKGGGDTKWRAGIYTKYPADRPTLINYVGDKFDVVEINPYDNISIDAPVLVKHSHSTRWLPRHFAGVSEEGNPLTWADGLTSWSCNPDNTITWDELRLPDEDLHHE